MRAFILDAVGAPLDGYTKENRFKLYFFDVGMLNAMSVLPPEVIMQYGFGSYQGYMAENFVAQELRAAGDDMLYTWQGRTSEVEFLIETGAGVVPWEVKSGRVVHAKSLSVYEERYRPKRCYILSSKNGYCQGRRCYVPIYAAGVIRNLMEKQHQTETLFADP